MNKIRVFTLIGAILFIYSSTTHGQTDGLNHKKYWYYRWRLENNFMKQGINQGEGCIANERGLTGDGANNSFLNFGDHTITISLYIASLAMEYNLLAGNNQQTEETVKDLYYALYTLNRLDLNAESLFRDEYGILDIETTDLNGFFVRDDVPHDFVTNNTTHFTSLKVESQINSISNYPNSCRSDWKVDVDKNLQVMKAQVNSSAEMSKDQVYYVIMAMAFVKKYIPTGVNYNQELFQDGFFDFNQEAEKILRRVIRYCNGKYAGKGTFFPWFIKNPVFDPEQNVNRGNSLAPFTFGVGQSACLITGGAGCFDFTNSYSATAGLVNWTLFELTGAPYATGNSDNSHMFGLLMAIAGEPNFSLTHQAGYMATELYHVPLIRQCLFGGGSPVNEQTYIDLLNSAPCEGPYYFHWNPGQPDHNSASYEWSTPNRVVHPGKRGNVGLKAEYPGVDYMFYHNLFYTVQNQYYNNPVNLVDNYINTDLPFLQYGTTQNPMEANIFNSIEADNTIAASNSFGAAKVTYRAGHSIRLKNGFNAQNGATFHAYTDPFSCASDGQFDVYKISSDSSADLSQHIMPHYSEELVSDNLFNFDETDPEIDNKLDFDISAVNTNELFEIQSAFNNIPNDLLFSVYPNPAVNELMLSFKISEGQELSNVTVQIFDMLGRKLDSRDVREIENSFDISSYPSGMYVIKIAFENGLFYKEAKFIKQ